MNKELIVMKIYPKINDEYVEEFSLSGFKITESKKQTIFFKKDKVKSFADVREKMVEFEVFIKKFNLPHSFEVEKTITYTEKKPKLSRQQVYNEIVNEEDAGV